MGVWNSTCSCTRPFAFSSDHLRAAWTGSLAGALLLALEYNSALKSNCKNGFPAVHAPPVLEQIGQTVLKIEGFQVHPACTGYTEHTRLTRMHVPLLDVSLLVRLRSSCS